MSCRITGKICDAWSDVAGCGLVRCKFVEKKDGGKVLNDETVTDHHQMTNADRIRASIEDNKKLAELTIKCKSVFSRTKGYTEILYVCSDGSVTDDWSIALNREMEWLQQPAEEMLADEATEGGDD